MRVIESQIWEGEQSSSINRALVRQMDDKFARAMRKHHPNRLSDPTLRAKPQALPKPVEITSLHRVEDDLDDAEISQIKAILRRPAVERVVQKVAQETGITAYLIVSQSRNKYVVAARNWVFYLLHQDGFGLAQLGRMFFKHHSTVLHGITCHRARMADA